MIKYFVRYEVKVSEEKRTQHSRILKTDEDFESIHDVAFRIVQFTDLDVEQIFVLALNKL